MKNNRHVPLLAISKFFDLKSHSQGSNTSSSFSCLHDMSDNPTLFEFEDGTSHSIPTR